MSLHQKKTKKENSTFFFLFVSHRSLLISSCSRRSAYFEGFSGALRLTEAVIGAIGIERFALPVLRCGRWTVGRRGSMRRAPSYLFIAEIRLTLGTQHLWRITQCRDEDLGGIYIYSRRAASRVQSGISHG